ncbi:MULTISPECIES: hypothetical protein [unclassified Gordonia (in: high G+C Gram-positive bacteria)]|uniref:hypothetical protein n=1 Tax=unclassified Gordonia (in: high G+C Gram-positive bacteria) TaxID=2657482 RepID=UPI000A859ED8|nr:MULTISPECIES: hypothetical protein [unclassified Gordonia (in: high G+C Gram-positive bacteria)]
MAQDHSAVRARLDELKAADPQAMFTELLRAGLQELIEAADRHRQGGAPPAHRRADHAP